RRRHPGATEAPSRRPRAQRPGRSGSRLCLAPAPAVHSCPIGPGPRVSAAGNPIRHLRRIGGAERARTRSARGAHWGAGGARGCGRARRGQVPASPDGTRLAVGSNGRLELPGAAAGERTGALYSHRQSVADRAVHLPHS
ncbi:gap junction membrane channel protein alpha 3, isoform CRA_b, partial [Mus musculus]